VEAIELDWGCGYVRHYAEVGRLGAVVRLSVVVMSRLAKGAAFDYVRVRFRNHESLGARVEHLEAMADGGVRLSLIAVPSPFAPRSSLDAREQSNQRLSGSAEATAFENATPPTRPKAP
jgi:hypothetical protein